MTSPPRILRFAGLALLAVLFMAAAPGYGAAGSLGERLARSREVVQEFLQGDQRPPSSLIDQSACIAVLPRVIKGAVGVGGRHGRGVMSCRKDSGEWSAPVFLTLSGGSLGLQVGAQSSDIVLFIISERSARSLMKSKFTLGADAEVAAGPRSAGAEATTDVRLDAEIYSYAKSKGFFAGVSLGGAKLKVRRKEISRYYPEKPLPEALLFGDARVELPPAAESFRSALP